MPKREGNRKPPPGDWRPRPKPTDPDGGEGEEEGDPEWIEFDPEKQRDKFFGHVMADE